MGKKDERVDAYIESSEEFAKPILRYLREVVHEGCPLVEETIKWKFPVFMYKGIMCNMASFKEHCAFGFWKPSLILEGDESGSEKAIGQFGRITSIADLPPKETLVGYVRRAMELNEKGIQPRKKEKKKPELEMPEDFASALRTEEGAWKAFEAMPPSHQREYIEWILEAKREATRRRRIEKAVGQISEGKSLNWKYYVGGYDAMAACGSRESGIERRKGAPRSR